MSADRTSQLAQVAYQLDMHFQEEDHWNLHDLLRDFSLFRVGRRRQITNMLYRADPFLDTEIHIFDYYYRQGKGRSGDHSQTVIFFHSKFLGLPKFEMRPETLLYKIGELLGFHDIDFEEYPVFSRQYRLKGEDEHYIRATLNDRTLQFFSEEKNWFLEGLNYYLVFYRRNVLVPPAMIRSFYDKGMTVFRMLGQESR